MHPLSQSCHFHPPFDGDTFQQSSPDVSSNYSRRNQGRQQRIVNSGPPVSYWTRFLLIYDFFLKTTYFTILQEWSLIQIRALYPKRFVARRDKLFNQMWLHGVYCAPIFTLFRRFRPNSVANFNLKNVILKISTIIRRLCFNSKIKYPYLWRVSCQHERWNIDKFE